VSSESAPSFHLARHRPDDAADVARGMKVIVFLDEVDSILTAWSMASRIVVRS
jgi:hypothetical protein